MSLGVSRQGRAVPALAVLLAGSVAGLATQSAPAANKNGPPSLPLGTTLEGDADREEIVEVPTGAVVVGYSDGAPEATSPSGETYGYEAWPAKLKEIAGEGINASGILEELLAGVARHRAGQRAEDDLTVVVLRLA